MRQTAILRMPVGVGTGYTRHVGGIAGSAEPAPRWPHWPADRARPHWQPLRQPVAGRHHLPSACVTTVRTSAISRLHVHVDTCIRSSCRVPPAPPPCTRGGGGPGCAGRAGAGLNRSCLGTTTHCRKTRTVAKREYFHRSLSNDTRVTSHVPTRTINRDAAARVVRPAPDPPSRRAAHRHAVPPHCQSAERPTPPDVTPLQLHEIVCIQATVGASLVEFHRKQR